VSDDGTWVAISTSSPYFLFKGVSEEQVVDLAKEAIAFYGNADIIRSDLVKKEGGKQLSTVYNAKSVNLGNDCVAA
jgi:predicted RNase H-like HicB family nuclease